MCSAMNNKSPGKLLPCPFPEDVLAMIKDQCGTRDQIMNFSSFSPSLYDTAWLSMVPTKNDQGARLSPQCLDIVLETQQIDGTWPSYASPVDGILVSLASLLAIATHHARTSATSEERLALTNRVHRGSKGLQKLLQSWNVQKAVHVGFEVLVISLMRQLESFAIHIDFPGLPELTRLYSEKMEKFSPELLYGLKQTTLLHSVEAFVGAVDFGRIAHHCSDELGIFGSPAATAAYLIHSPVWDQRAEKYLGKVVAAYGSTGLIPSAFPTPLFEASWAISSILSPIIDQSTFGNVDLSIVKSLFQGIIVQQGSLVGFAPGILEDADDTSRVLLMLMRLRRLDHEVTTDVEPLVSKFEAADCFKTYELERNASFSANCNVVLALLETDDRPDSRYHSQIKKAVNSLLDTVETGARDITDKWNMSSEYSTMLLFEVMLAALKQYDTGRLQTLPREVFTNRIPKLLCRLTSQLLDSQKSDGSWSHSLEVTSYSILGLTHILRLPWGRSIHTYLTDRIAHAKIFLGADYPKTEQKDYLWVEKTTYQSSLLRMAYCSMALHITATKEKWSKSMTETFTCIDTQTSGMKRLFSNLPLLKDIPNPLLDLILVEAKHHTHTLATNKHALMPGSDSSPRVDKYLAYIPVIWLLGNQINNQALSANIIHEMLVFSQMTYQIDELMETAVDALSAEDTSAFETWVRRECSPAALVEQEIGAEHCKATRNGTSNGLSNNHSSPLSTVQNALQRFLQHTLHHRTVQASPLLIQQHLATDLSSYLLSHMHQNHSNALLKSTLPPTLPSYFTWARSTGATSTSCPMAFRFYSCLIANSMSDGGFESAQAQYLSSSVAQHLATLCRQYNDYGSVARDADENNLNSVDFAEFRPGSWVHETNAHDADRANTGGLMANGELGAAKQQLMGVAEFERKLMEVSFKALGEVVKEQGVMERLRVLVDVTDLFGEVYVVRDVGVRKTTAAHVAVCDIEP